MNISTKVALMQVNIEVTEADVQLLEIEVAIYSYATHRSYMSIGTKKTNGVLTPWIHLKRNA